MGAKRIEAVKRRGDIRTSASISNKNQFEGYYPIRCYLSGPSLQHTVDMSAYSSSAEIVVHSEESPQNHKQSLTIS